MTARSRTTEPTKESPAANHTPQDALRLFTLAGKSALVTGAARGIGRAVAEGLASIGVQVVVTDVNAGELRRTEARIVEAHASGSGCLALPAELTDDGERARLVEQSVEHFGGIDILVNCAAITRSTPSERYPREDWDSTLAVNLSAVFHLCREVATRTMLPRRRGSIINVCSINSVVAFPNNPAYQAAKGGLLQLTRALATDWAKYNIRVNNICPGYFNTPLSRKSYEDPRAHAVRARRTMLNRWGEPGEMVGPVIFLASDASSYVTGNDLFVDGGWAASGLTEAQDAPESGSVESESSGSAT